MDFKSFIVFSFSILLHLIIPFSPSNLVKYIPNSLYSLLKSRLHCFLISSINSNLLIFEFSAVVLITKPMYLCRLPSLIICYTSKTLVFYSDSIRGASRYFTCPLLSAISNSTFKDKRRRQERSGVPNQPFFNSR